MDIRRIPEIKSHKRFPWTVRTTNLLLDLYAKKIEILMDSARSAKPAWEYVVSKMRAELRDEFDEEVLSVLSHTRAISKFNALKQIFKRHFFDFQRSDTEKQMCFPFYNKMNLLFTDYAMRHLNSTASISHVSENYNESIHNSTTAADVTDYIVQILNSEDQDKTSITILPYNDQENFSEHISSVTNGSNSHKNGSTMYPSETEKVRMNLAKMPTEAVYISQQKLRIDPNTPFNRNVSNSTILHQRSLLHHNTQLPPLKRRALLSELEPSKTKKKSSFESPEQDHVHADNSGQDFYYVEALDECELSDISVRRSKAIYHDTTPELSPPSDDNQSSHKIDVHSVVIIPPPPTFDDSDQTIDDVPRNEKFSETIKGVPSKQIVPKKLIIKNGDESSRTSAISLMNLKTPEKQEQAPEWFQDFLKQYKSDVKQINEKLDKIIAGNQKSSPVLVHPKIATIKRL